MATQQCEEEDKLEVEPIRVTAVMQMRENSSLDKRIMAAR